MRTLYLVLQTIGPARPQSILYCYSCLCNHRPRSGYFSHYPTHPFVPPGYIVTDNLYMSTSHLNANPRLRKNNLNRSKFFKCQVSLMTHQHVSSESFKSKFQSFCMFFVGNILSISTSKNNTQKIEAMFHKCRCHRFLDLAPAISSKTTIQNSELCLGASLATGKYMSDWQDRPHSVICHLSFVIYLSPVSIQSYHEEKAEAELSQ